MHIFETKKALQGFLLDKENIKKTIGFVPTMGALHRGHLSLVDEAQKENDLVVVSIFVNPTQFNNQDDLLKYPKPISKDIEFLESVNCDVLFHPSADEIYNGTLSSEHFDFNGLENVMEGTFRQGHFDGVGTIVKKLFDIVNPNIAYFGEKDFQQLQIIKTLVDKYNLPVKIKGCPILREKDGLAMSSRNGRLTETHRKESPFIYKTLKEAKNLFENHSVEFTNDWVSKAFKNNKLLQLEYFTIADETTLAPIKDKSTSKNYRAFIAVHAGDIRLIDNIPF